MTDPMDVDDVASIYSRHIEDAQALLQDGSTSDESVMKVRSLLIESSLLSKKERCVQETIMGGTALSLCAQIARNQVQAIDTNLSSFDPESFKAGIAEALLDPDKANPKPDWKRLSRKVSRLFKRAPVFSYLYGSFKPTEPPPKDRKERTQRSRRTAANEADKKKPEKVQNVEAKEEGNDVIIMRMKKILKKEFEKRNNQPINYFECVLNPESFSRSVENIFYLAFLIRDNFIRVENPPGTVPFIHLVQEQESNRYQNGRKRQCIVQITMKHWQELVKAYKITSSIIS